MKRCTWCGKEYSDEATVCAVDQHELEQKAQTHSKPEPAFSQADKKWLLHVLLPAIAWLISLFIIGGLFGFGGTLVFGLITAVWAALDCSSLRADGTRVLGIAFKPVVVFAVVAFFLWGFGFIWYLVMRNRVTTAAMNSANKEPVAQPANTWDCPKCGEVNPKSFTSCWNCGPESAAITREHPELPHPAPSHGGNARTGSVAALTMRLFIFFFLGLFGLYLFCYLPTLWPPAWIRRISQFSAVDKRVQQAGGWGAIRVEALALAQERPKGFEAFRGPGNYSMRVTRAPDDITTNMPPAITALNPMMVDYLPAQGCVRLKIYGSHATGGPSIPYFAVEIETAPDPAVYKRGTADRHRWTTKKVAEGVYEVY